MGVVDSKLTKHKQSVQAVQLCCCQHRKEHARLLNPLHSPGSQLYSEMVFGRNNLGSGDKSVIIASCENKEFHFGTQSPDSSPMFPRGWTEGQYVQLNSAVQCSRRIFQCKAPLKLVTIQVMFILDTISPFYCP